MKKNRLQNFTQIALTAAFGLNGCAESESPPAATPATVAASQPATAQLPPQQDWLGERPSVPEPASFTPPAPNVYKTVGGLQVWLIERHTLPVVSVSVSVPVGSANDAKGLAGLAFAMTEMLSEGAGQRSSSEMARALDTLGARATTSTDTDSSTVSLSVPKKDFAAAVALVGDMISRPRFDDSDWKRVSDLWRSDLKARASDPVEVLRVVSRTAFFGNDHPYGHPVEGTIQGASRITLDDVRRFYGTAWQPERATIVVAGDVSKAELDPILDDAFRNWKRGGGGRGPATIAKPTGPWPRVILVDRPDAPQANIAFIRPGLAMSDADVPVVSRANIAFGGAFASRINLDLREEHGWSYGARSMLFSGRGAGALVAAAAVFVDKTGDALSALLADADVFAKKGLTDEEVTKTKALSRAESVAASESVVSLTARLALHASLGLPADFDAQTWRRRDEATHADLDNAARSYFDPLGSMVVVVGPQAKIAPQLEAIGMPAPDMRCRREQDSGRQERSGREGIRGEKGPMKSTSRLAPDAIRLADGADANAFAVMVSELVRQNLDSKPSKVKDFNGIDGSVVIIAHDADVALTLRFTRGRLVVYDGTVGIPDVTIRGSSEVILGLSSIPLLNLPLLSLPVPSEPDGFATMVRLVKAMKDGSFRIYGLTFNIFMLLKLTRVMSIHDPLPVRTLATSVERLAKKARNRH